jgi:four helix bundle protein
MSKSFEDIEVWKLSRIFVKEIYEVTRNNFFEKDWDLRNQIRRASVSILSNISEGFERKSTKEFSNFLNIAKGSAGEVRSQLFIAFDLKYLTENEFEKFSNDVIVISKSLGGFIKYLDAGQKK